MKVISTIRTKRSTACSAPLVATLWTPSADVASVPRRLDDLQFHTGGPPLRVRYSRLAL